MRRSAWVLGACMPNSTSSTTGTCARATCSAQPSSEARAWEKHSKRAGVLKFSETITEYRDQSGELVITARSVGVTTEKAVEG